MRRGGPIFDLKVSRTSWPNRANQPPARRRGGAFRREKGAMRRFATVSFAIALIASLAGTASAASISLTATPVVSPGVFRVDMNVDLGSASTNLLALQFDLDLDLLGKSLAPTPGFSTANSNRDDGTTAHNNTPFDLSANIGDPTGAIDVRVVYAANDLFSVNSLNAE